MIDAKGLKWTRGDGERVECEDGRYLLAHRDISDERVLATINEHVHGIAPINRTALAAEIDEAVASVLAPKTRFAMEYEAREAAAIAFKAAGYPAKDVPDRVAEFALPAGLSARAACDRILVQAGQLRAAQGALAGLRMRKYEILRAASDEAAVAARDAIKRAIDEIAGLVA